MGEPEISGIAIHRNILCLSVPDFGHAGQGSDTFRRMWPVAATCQRSKD